MYPKKPFSASYWLKSNQILAGELPTSVEASTATPKLKALLEAGVQTVINLLEIAEFEQRPYATGSYPDYTGELKQLGKDRKININCIRFPIIDMGIPTIPEMTQILDCIDRNLAENRPVYFHCFAGLGRTGTVAGCWLVRQGLNGENALQELDSVRAVQGTDAYGPSPQNDLQCNFVRQWKQGQ